MNRNYINDIMDDHQKNLKVKENLLLFQVKRKARVNRLHERSWCSRFCSYEARKFGIHSGMPMRAALRLCSHAVIIKSDFDAYTKYSRLVTEIIKDKVPFVRESKH